MKRNLFGVQPIKGGTIVPDQWYNCEFNFRVTRVSTRKIQAYVGFENWVQWKLRIWIVEPVRALIGRWAETTAAGDIINVAISHSTLQDKPEEAQRPHRRQGRD